MALWGIAEDNNEELDEFIQIWPENWEAITWWVTIPSFLKWNMNHCMGMDVMAVRADAEMSGREINPDDYHRLKLIARTVTEELNGRKQ